PPQPFRCDPAEQLGGGSQVPGPVRASGPGLPPRVAASGTNARPPARGGGDRLPQPRWLGARPRPDAATCRAPSPSIAGSSIGPEGSGLGWRVTAVSIPVCARWVRSSLTGPCAGCAPNAGGGSRQSRPPMSAALEAAHAEALVAHRNGLPAPSPLTADGTVTSNRSVPRALIGSAAAEHLVRSGADLHRKRRQVRI